MVPVRVEGGWQWDATIGANTYRFSALMEQRMQQAEGVVRVGNRRESLQHVLLRGDSLQFTLRMTLPGAGYIGIRCAGRVRGDTIEARSSPRHRVRATTRWSMRSAFLGARGAAPVQVISHRRGPTSARSLRGVDHRLNHRPGESQPCASTAAAGRPRWPESGTGLHGRPAQGLPDPKGFASIKGRGIARPAPR